MKLNAIKKSVLGQPSYIISSSTVELAVTELGGQTCPVTFCTDTENPVMPYFISPWQLENLPGEGSYRDAFRGDFFCLPFGGGRGGGPMHGETAASKWLLDGCEKNDGRTTLALHMDPQNPAFHIEKRLTLVDGHNAFYTRHSITGLEGQFSYSHHATLNVTPEREGVISTSPTYFGFTGGGGVFNEREHAYNFLAGGKQIDSMEAVPSVWKDNPVIDCSRVPAALNFSSSTQFYHVPGSTPGWTCVWFPKQNFVWYALKDPVKQPIVNFWLEFGGRYEFPWNGRTSCIGVEDMRMSFPPAFRSRMGERIKMLEDAGIRSDFAFKADEAFSLGYVQGVAQVEEDFGKVSNITFGNGEMTLVSQTGRQKTVPVDWTFCLS